jgi:hypothetical protein
MKSCPYGKAVTRRPGEETCCARWKNLLYRRVVTSRHRRRTPAPDGFGDGRSPATAAHFIQAAGSTLFKNI